MNKRPAPNNFHVRRTGSIVVAAAVVFSLVGTSAARAQAKESWTVVAIADQAGLATAQIAARQVQAELRADGVLLVDDPAERARDWLRSPEPISVVDNELRRALRATSELELVYDEAAPSHVAPRDKQWERADPRFEGALVQGTPQGARSDRIWRHLQRVRSVLGIPRLIAVHVDEDQVVLTTIRDGNAESHEGRLPLFELGSPRASCAGPRPSWLTVVLRRLARDEELMITPEVARQRAKAERAQCSRQSFERKGAT